MCMPILQGRNQQSSAIGKAIVYLWGIYEYFLIPQALLQYAFTIIVDLRTRNLSALQKQKQY
jgi:hypothetical protein